MFDGFATNHCLSRILYMHAGAYYTTVTLFRTNITTFLCITKFIIMVDSSTKHPYSILCVYKY